MKIKFLNSLICPICHNTLTFLIHRKTTKGRIVEAELNCEACNKKFYIKKGIACFAFPYRKPTKNAIKKLRKITLEQEVPKRWIRFYSKQEIGVLKKEWNWILSIIKKKKKTLHLDFATGTGRFIRNVVSKTKGEIIALEHDYPTCLELQYFLKKIKNIAVFLSYVLTPVKCLSKIMCSIVYHLGTV